MAMDAISGAQRSGTAKQIEEAVKVPTTSVLVTHSAKSTAELFTRLERILVAIEGPKPQDGSAGNRPSPGNLNAVLCESMGYLDSCHSIATEIERALGI